MLIAVFILLGFSYGLLGHEVSETKCRILADEKCKVLETVLKVFPGNNEEVEEVCQNVYEVKQCIKDYVNKCMESGSFDQEILETWMNSTRLINTMTEVCQKDSDIHTNFVQDIACFKEAFVASNVEGEQACLEHTKRVDAHLRRRLDIKFKEWDIMDYTSLSTCMEKLVDMNCILRNLNVKCGARAKDTALKIMDRFIDFEDRCPPAIRVVAMEFLAAWNSVSKTGIYVKELILSEI